MCNGKDKEIPEDSVEEFLARSYAPLSWEEQKPWIAELNGPRHQEAVEILFKANTLLILKVGLDVSRSWYKRYLTQASLDDVLSVLIQRFLRILKYVDPERGRLSTVFIHNVFHDLYENVFRFDAPCSVLKRFSLSVEEMNTHFGTQASADNLGWVSRGDSEDPQVICEREDLLVAIREVLDKLSPEDRRVIGTYWTSENFKQYMQAMRISRSVATVRRMRAMTRLCTQLSSRLNLPLPDVLAKVNQSFRPGALRKLCNPPPVE